MCGPCIATVPWRYVHPRSVHVALQPKRSSPMDRHLAPPISGSWSPGAAWAVDGASLLHGPLRVDRTAETEKKLNGWTDRGWTQHQGTIATCMTEQCLDYLIQLYVCISKRYGVARQHYQENPGPTQAPPRRFEPVTLVAGSKQVSPLDQWDMVRILWDCRVCTMGLYFLHWKESKCSLNHTLTLWVPVFCCNSTQ